MDRLLLGLTALFFTCGVSHISAATLSAAVPAANKLLRREDAADDLEAPADSSPVNSIVVGSAGHGILARPRLSEEEMFTKTSDQKKVNLKAASLFPFQADELRFEFRVAPLRWGRCKQGNTVQLSSSDESWKACAARVQSTVGEASCNRRRGNMIWPKTTEYALDNATVNYPCECCADDPYENFNASVNKADAIWNVVWNKDCNNFTGESACGTSIPEDSHALDSADCEGGACNKTDDRWTCCDKRCHEIESGQKGSCLSENNTVHKINEDTFVGNGWGPPYRPSESMASYATVDSQHCGSRGRRPAMPKTADQRAQLVASMRNWSKSIGYVWMGLTKDEHTERWLWDDESPLDPQPIGKLLGAAPWGKGEPTQLVNQRGCIDARTGTWHGCSFSVKLRIACESWT